MDEVLVSVQAIAERQHGVVSLRQMMEAGAQQKWVSRRKLEGVLIPGGPGVYRLGGARSTFESRALASVLSARGPALVSHQAAAYLHGIGQRAGVVPGFVDLTVERHRRPARRAGLTVHETSAMDLAGATVRNLIPVTGVARTILDCSTLVKDPLKMLDDACRLGLVTWPDLWSCYLAHRARGRALSAYKAILQRRDGNTSPGAGFNRIMAELLVSAGLAEPVFEHRVVVNGHEYYLDLAWPERLVCVECNDDGSHRTGKGFYRDPMKRNRCQKAGWDYHEYTWFDTVESPGEIVEQVGAALGRRAA